MLPEGSWVQRPLTISNHPVRRACALAGGTMAHNRVRLRGTQAAGVLRFSQPSLAQQGFSSSASLQAVLGLRKIDFEDTHWSESVCGSSPRGSGPRAGLQPFANGSEACEGTGSQADR